MGRHQAGIDDAAGGIEPRLVGLGVQGPHLRNDAVADADRARRPHGIAGASGKNAGRVLDQHRGHVSAPISLSCQLDSASRDTATMIANNATPVSVIRKSAANIRGMSNVKPASRIS